jgi:hypothetical protein
MRTGTELLELQPSAPLTSVLVARPVRVCAFVPDIQGLPWERLVEHALAVQTRVWGGGANLVVPLGWELADDELFWRLIDQFDPDVIAEYAPTFADFEELDPDRFAADVQTAREQMAGQGLGPETQEAELARRREDPILDWHLSDNLSTKLVERVAPLHLDDLGPRTVIANGTHPIGYPLTDVASLRELPTAVADVATTLGDRQQLELTAVVGRLLPSLKRDLADHPVAIGESIINNDGLLVRHVWGALGLQAGVVYPSALAETGLVRRLSTAQRGQVVVVVGDERRDFLLFHSLSRLRPYVYWLPAARLADARSIGELGEAVRRTAQYAIGGGNLIAVTTATDQPAVEAAVEALNGIPGQGTPQAVVVEWTEVVPRAALWVADARSEQRAALLRHEGETQELPTPIPVSISAENPFDVRWMVDVEVRGWTPTRNRTAPGAIFRGPLVSPHDVRTSRLGPSYFGLSALTQSFLGLEGSTARPRLAPLTVVDQVRHMLKPHGWEVSLSDKGAYAAQSARLFGGVDALAHALRDPPTRELLDAYLTSTETNEPGRFLKDTRRRYLRLQDVTGLIVTANVAGRLAGADAGTLVAALYDNSVLRRGHLLKCEHCRATSFYSLTEYQQFTCVRCLTAQRATRFSWLGEAEPEFYYALSEVLFQFLKNNGQLPLLSAYDHFVVGRKRERQAFDIAFEMELAPGDAEVSEHDIVASWGSELWLGEATAVHNLGSQNAERKRLRRLKQVAGLVNAYGVLFVTESEQFGEPTKTNIGTIFDDRTWPQIVYVEGFSSGPREEEQGEPEGEPG